MEEQISSNEQEEDAEEREQSTYNSERNSANANCAVDDELYKDQRAKFGAILVFQQ